MAAFTPPPEIRHDTSLVDGWRFIKNDVAGAEQENFNDESWAVISIPHTWNAQDGQDGGDDYHRGTGFYRCHFSIDASEAGRQLHSLQWRQHGNGRLGQRCSLGPTSRWLRDVPVRNDLRGSRWRG